MLSTRWSFLAVAPLLAVLVAVPEASADIIQSTPSMPPEGSYTTPSLCVPLGPGVCIVNPALHGFNGTTRSTDLSGESIDSNIFFSASVYTDAGGHPGTLLGPLSLEGPIGIFYAGRTSDSELGTFTSTLTELDVTGTFNGHSVEIMLTPPASTGITTISAVGSDFAVSSFFDVFAEISIDHGPFIVGAERTFTLTPEPGTVSLLALGLVGVTAGELRRRIRSLLTR